jgi:CheY-like chemotaxis protein
MLWLPCAEGRSTETVSLEPDGSILHPSLARILVCDDDGDVRAFVATYLRDNGCTVWEANSPTLALKILEREQPIDLLLVDHAMPEMTGPAVIDRARAYQPGLKTLLMTGHADALRAAELSGVRALSKPFKVAELSQRIAEILASS